MYHFVLLMYKKSDYHDFLRMPMYKGLSLHCNVPNEQNEQKIEYCCFLFFYLLL